MADYAAKLTPNLINMGTEGYMDTSIVNGVSKQRTLNFIDVANGTNSKVVCVDDGEEFSDAIQGLTDIPGIVSA